MPSVTAVKSFATSPEAVDHLDPKVVKERLAPFSRPDNRIANIELAKSVAVYLGCQWALSLFSNSWVLRIALIMLFVLIKIRLFVQFHDMGHGSFYTSLTANRWVGHVIGSLTNTPFDSWKVPHSTHHVHLAKSDRNEEQHGEIPMWTVDQYRAQSPWVRWAYSVYRHPIAVFAVIPQFVFLVSYRFVSDHLVCNLLIAARLLIQYQCGLLADEIIASVISNSFGFYLFFGQHTFNPFLEQTHEKYDIVKAGVHASTYFKMSKAMHWFTANIGYHHIHHITVKVPSYYLVQAHNATRDLWRAVTRTSFAGVWRNRNLALWDDEAKVFATCADVERRIRADTAAGIAPSPSGPIKPMKGKKAQ